MRTPPSLRISALIVNYRTYGELTGCLAALGRALDPTRDEVIVVDAESDAPALSAALDVRPGTIALPSDDNPGFGAGVNRGAGQAHGRYLLALNPDTWIEPGAVDVLVDRLESYPQAGVVGPRLHDGEGNVEASARRHPGLSTLIGGRNSWLTRLWPSNPVSRRNLLDISVAAGGARRVDWLHGACLLFRREAFEHVDGFDTQFFLYWEDADICRRLEQAGWDVWYEPGASVLHHGARSSAQRPVTAARAFHASVLRYYVRYGGPAAMILRPLAWLALQLRLGALLALTRRH